MDNVIRIGHSAEAPFLAYGDESKKGDVLVYAYVIFARKEERKIAKALSYLKKDFGIPREYPLHCKVLMHGDALRDKGLGHLTGYDGLKILRRIVTMFNEHEIEVRYAYESFRRLSASIGEKLVLQSTTGEDDLVMDVVHAYQGHLGFLSGNCLAIPGVFPTTQCEFFAAEDSTQVKFVGPGAARADSRYGTFSDVGAPHGKVLRIEPKLLNANAHFGLELADVAAYLCVNALQPGEPKSPFYKEQLARVKLYSSRGIPIPPPACIELRPQQHSPIARLLRDFHVLS